MIVKFTDAEHACHFGMGQALDQVTSVSDFTIEYHCPVCDARWEYSFKRRDGKWESDRNCIQRSSPEWREQMIALLDDRPGRNLNFREKKK